MGSLGEFGAARRESDPERERDTITLCGVEFMVADAIDPMAILDFGEAAAGGIDGNSAEGMAAMKSLIRSAVDEAEWPRLRATIRQHRPTVDVLMELAMVVVQRETGRPTLRPSDSADGSSDTGPSSKADSSSAASSTPGTWRDSPLGRRELAANPEVYADVLPLDKAARQVATLAG